MINFIPGLIGAGVNVIGGVLASGEARRRQRAADAEKQRLGIELNRLENSRQAIVNPWATTTDMSSLIKDNSSLMRNAFANLGVATQASKFEAEQIDTSLANTLDTLRETGASAGGATALAQAALKAKQGISANLEQQEAKNDQLRAQGQQELDKVKLAEANKVEAARLSEAQRVQGAQAAGEQFMFNAREERENQKINRVASQLGLATNQYNQAGADATAAITGAVGNIGSIFQTMAGTLGGNSTSSNNLSGTANPTTIGVTQGPAYNPASPISAAPLSSAISGGNPAIQVTGGWSDRRLKKNITNIGKSNNGLNIYSFEYIDKKYGNGLYQGVMSDEIPSYAVLKGSNGYDMVDYSLLDVEFKKI